MAVFHNFRNDKYQLQFLGNAIVYGFMDDANL